MVATKGSNVIVDAAALTPRVGSAYPAPFAEICQAREKRALGDTVGIASFGVNLTRLPPGTASGQRHWHGKEDEFVYVLEGEVVLVMNAGETVLKPGMAVGFPAGVADGHQLINRSDRDVVFLEVGDRDPADTVEYADIDMKGAKIDGKWTFFHKDGTPY